MTSTILIVDDQPIGREILMDLLLSAEYALYQASNGAEALQKAAEILPDLILLDVMMPDMSGYEVCQKLRADPNLAEVPVLMLTAMDDFSARMKGIEVGADDCITKPFNRMELRAQVKTITRLSRYRKLHNERANLEDAHNKLLEAYDATIAGWSLAMELRDADTKNHSQRVTDLTVKLARDIGICEEEIVHIRRGALLHDIGKLAVPDRILCKPDRLTEQEWILMKKHPQNAYDMLMPIEYLQPALDIPYCHHEHWDGSGYPRGLKGEDIPLAARIFAVVDVWDALTSQRPYRAAWSEEAAYEYIQSHSGTDFDPRIVEKFLELLNTVLAQFGQVNQAVFQVDILAVNVDL